MRIVTTRPAVRCAVCHDDLEPSALQAVCPGCELRGHLGCLIDARGCPSLGCGRGRPPTGSAVALPSPPPPPAPGPPPAPPTLPAPSPSTGRGDDSPRRRVVGPVAGFAGGLAVAAVVVVGNELAPPGAVALELRREMRELRVVLELYREDTGQYPERIDDLLVPTAPGWRGPYYQGFATGPVESLLDPWGAPYRLICGGPGVSILSCGPDRARGTEDDVFVLVGH